VALGACIGLAVALAQIILREAWLRVDSGFRPGRQLLLTRPETQIGRAEACDLGLFGDPTVEKVHAKILRKGNQWLLADAGTASGTMLNGQRITGPTPLHSGDRIQVGNCVLSFGTRTKESGAVPTAVPLPA
jgi:predicted component of type VI protein secretion system